MRGHHRDAAGRAAATVHGLYERAQVLSEDDRGESDVVESDEPIFCEMFYGVHCCLLNATQNAEKKSQSENDACDRR